MFSSWKASSISHTGWGHLLGPRLESEPWPVRVSRSPKCREGSTAVSLSKGISPTSISSMLLTLDSNDNEHQVESNEEGQEAEKLQDSADNEGLHKDTCAAEVKLQPEAGVVIGPSLETWTKLSLFQPLTEIIQGSVAEVLRGNYTHSIDLKKLTIVITIKNTCRGVLHFTKGCCIYQWGDKQGEQKSNEDKRETTNWYIIICRMNPTNSNHRDIRGEKSGLRPGWVGKESSMGQRRSERWRRERTILYSLKGGYVSFFFRCQTTNCILKLLCSRQCARCWIYSNKKDRVSAFPVSKVDNVSK